MRTNDSFEADWQALISNLSISTRLRVRAGALVRRRAVTDGATLLRLALACGPGGLPASGCRPLRVVDGSSISRPGSSGTDWRLHATYEPALARFTHLELSDVYGGEGFSRVPVRSGDIVLGDRAYARAPALQNVVSAGADFIVRMAWSNVRLTSLDGEVINLNTIYDAMKPGDVSDHDVLVEYSGPGSKHRGKPLFCARLVVRRKDEEATARAEKVARRRHQKRAYDREMHPLTVATSGFLLLLTSVPA